MTAALSYRLSDVREFSTRPAIENGPIDNHAAYDWFQAPIRQHHEDLQMDEVLLRTTFIVEDMEAAIAFYRDVFGWSVVYDTVLNVDRRFPPAAADGARSRLVIFQAEDPEIGGIGFMKYLDDPIDEGPGKHRPRLAKGEAILVIKSPDPDAVYERLKTTDAVIVSPPVDWEVPGPAPGQIIRLRTMALFDPNGVYMEVNLKYPD